MPAYRIPSPQDRPPLRRRASGLALALAVNLGLLFVLLGIGRFAPEVRKQSRALIVDLVPESHGAAQRQERTVALSADRPEPPPRIKPPPLVIPSRPTIAPPPRAVADKPLPWVELSRDEMAAADLANGSSTAGAGREGDSEEVGRGPHGEVLYAAEWARHPTDAELGGYLPPNAPEGWGLIACKTVPDDRVDDCIELDQEPHGSHLASAVRQAAWQFRVRPPRKNGRPLVGEWVEIRIDYVRSARD